MKPALKDTELELKKLQMRKKRRRDKFKRRMIVFVFLFFCAGIIFTVLKAPFFNIKSIICIGQERLAQEEIIKAAEVRTGVNIFTVNITAAKRRVASIPAVSESNVRRIFPNKIKIWVRESKEAAFVKISSGAALIDKDGKILRTVSDDDEALGGMAELSGIDIASEKPGECIADTEELASRKIFECIGILDKLDMIGKIKKIDMRDLSDIKINYEDRLNILLGSYENVEYKLNFIKKVINENMSEYERANMDYRGEDLYVGPMESLEKEEESAKNSGEKNFENTDNTEQSEQSEQLEKEPAQSGAKEANEEKTQE